jgi:hypothetical protein
MTKSQAEALEWLTKRGGDGMFDRNGVLLAAGESAPFMRSTWNKLVELRRVEFYGGRSGRGRARLCA